MQERFWLRTGALIGVAALVVAIYLSSYGYEFTDEGFYLASTATPAQYVYFLSLFGYVYHLPYVALHGSIAGLRALNMVVSYGLAWGLSYLVVRSFLHRASRRMAGAVATASASVSLLIVCLQGKWLAVPSYNSLAFAAILLIGIGVVLCCAVRLETRTFAGWVLIGVGGWLAFMSKPSTAALLALATPVAIAACGRLEWRGVTLAGSTACLLVLGSALAISGSIHSFIEMLTLSISIMKRDGTGHDLGSSLLRMGAVPTGPRALAIYAVAPVLFVAAWRIGLVHARRIVGVYFVIVLGVALFIERNGIGNAYAKEAFVQLVLICALFIACLLLIAAARVRSAGNLMGRQRVAIAGFFLILPHVYAFGTNNDALAQAVSAGIFWFLGGVILLSYFLEADWLERVLPIFSVASASFSLLIILVSADSPYRQTGPLWQAHTPVEIGAHDAMLVVHAPEAGFLARVRASATAAQMPSNQPIIDLSGKSPGLIFALGARSVGSAWLVGGYSGSDETAMEILRTVSCSELGSAWILTGTVRPLSLSLPQSFGARLFSDYEQIGYWTNPLDQDQLALFRPLRSALRATEQCVRSRVQ